MQQPVYTLRQKKPHSSAEQMEELYNDVEELHFMQKEPAI
jgi:hypothetical protein